MNIMQNKQLQYIYGFIILSLILSSFCIGREAKVNMIEVSLVTDKKFGFVKLTYKNILNEDIWITKWDIASSGNLTKNLFNVDVKGVDYSYKGIYVKRSEPKGTDLIKIKSFESISSVIDLRNVYGFNESSIDVTIWIDAFIPMYLLDNGNVKLKGFTALKSSKVTFIK